MVELDGLLETKTDGVTVDVTVMLMGLLETVEELGHAIELVMLQ
jgi:hypothetical protein